MKGSKMFWTMVATEDDPRMSETLCEHHALHETNSALDLVDGPGPGGDAFGSMAEAYAVMTTLAAMAGFEYGLVSSEEGECAKCESEAQQDVA